MSETEKFELIKHLMKCLLSIQKNGDSETISAAIKIMLKNDLVDKFAMDCIQPLN